MKKFFRNIAVLAFASIVAVSTFTSTEVVAGQLRNDYEVDASKKHDHFGMTLEEIYGYQDIDGASWHDEVVFEVENQKINAMVDSGTLVMQSQGVYLHSDGTMYIDASVANSHTGLTLEELYGYQISNNSIVPLSTSMPSSTWSWSSGDYLNRSFSINHSYVYTQFLFTGYSEYYTTTSARRSHWTPASDYYTVYLMTGTGQGTIVASHEINSTNSIRVRWFNLNAGTRYAYAIGKANDGSTLSGTISVSRQ